MVDQHAMRHPRTAVVRQHAEAREAERLHQLHHVLRHLPFAVRRVVHAGIGRRLVAVAVAAQVGRDQREMPAERWPHLAPDQVRLRVTVQQQQRWFAAIISDTGIECDAVGGNAMEGSVRDHARSLELVRWPQTRIRPSATARPTSAGSSTSQSRGISVQRSLAAASAARVCAITASVLHATSENGTALGALLPTRT